MRFVVLALAISFYIPNASAAEFDCTNDQTQVAMNACAAQEADAMANKLQEYVAQKQKELDCNNKEGECDTQLLSTFNEAQNAWQTYMNKQCEHEARFYEGGSMQPMIFSSCKNTIIQQRIELLETNSFPG